MVKWKDKNLMESKEKLYSDQIKTVTQCVLTDKTREQKE